MTANQINYMKYMEDVRSHKAQETQAARQAASAEKQAEVAAENAITNRMNAETNKQNSLINESAVGAQWYGAQANAAYQTAMAAVSEAQQRETAKHNRTTEGQQWVFQGWTDTTNRLKIQTDRQQREADRKKDYVLGFANILGQGATKLVQNALPLLIGG